MYCQFDNYSYLGRCTEGHEPEPYSLQSLLNTSAFDTSTDAVIHQTASKKEKSKNQVHPENICRMCSILWETEEDQTKRFQKVLDESYWKKRLKNNLYRFLKIILSKKYSSVQEFFFFFLQPLLFTNDGIIIPYHFRELNFSEMLIKVLK